MASNITLVKTLSFKDGVKEYIKELTAEETELRNDMRCCDFRDDSKEHLQWMHNTLMRKSEIEFILSHLKPVVEKL